MTGFAHHVVVGSVAREEARKTRINLQMTVLSTVVSVNIDVSFSYLLFFIYACFSRSTAVFSLTINYFDADHIGCLKSKGLVKPDYHPDGIWFCNTRCEKVQY